MYKDCCVKRGRDLKYRSKTASQLYNYITIYIFYHIEKILLQMQSNIFNLHVFVMYVCTNVSNCIPFTNVLGGGGGEDTMD